MSDSFLGLCLEMCGLADGSATGHSARFGLLATNSHTGARHR